ncbi:hypothetical protein P9112_008243 [Eukaryota sp. TZLM1-RC]
MSQPLQPAAVQPNNEKTSFTTSLESVRFVLPERSLGLFHLNSNLRTSCLKLVFNPFFDWFVLFIVLLSVAPLFFLSHQQASAHEPVLFYVDLVFTTFFTIEILIRSIAVGLFTSPNSLLRDPFSCMDFVIVLLSIISFSPLLSSRPTIFRLLRVFRPLRSLNSVPALKRVSRSLARTVPAIWPVLIFLSFFVFVGAVFGVHMFRGVFQYRCVPINQSNQDIILIDGWEKQFNICSVSNFGQSCDVIDYECRSGFPNPRNNYLSFDNIFYSILNVFWSLTLEGWSHQASFAFESMGHLGYWFIFFVAIGGAFCLLNLFTAIIATKYSEVDNNKEFSLIKDEFSGEYNLVLVTEQTRRLYNIDEEVQTDVQEVANNKGKNDQKVGLIKRCCSKIVLTFYFELLSTIFVLSNLIVLSVFHYNMSEQLENNLAVVNKIITILFVIEVLLRIGCTGGLIKHFKNSFFDAFDIIVVSFALLELILHLPQFKGFSVLRVFRLIRVLRIVSLSRSWKSFHRLLSTIAASMKQLAPFITILIILLFIFSAIGVEIFDSAKISELNDPNSFYFFNFFKSLENTWLTATGEAWDRLSAETLDFAKDRLIGGLFFITIIIVFSFLLTNLLIGIIIVNFVDARKADQVQDQSIQVDCDRIDSKGNVIDLENSRKSIKVKPSPDEKAQYSLKFFHIDHPVRRFCLKLSNSSVFNFIIYLFVFISCIILALEQPDVDPSHWSRAYSQIILNIIALIFLIEFFVNSIALSLFGVNGIFKSPFLAFDSIIIIITSLEVVIPIDSSLYLVRSLRALRPLRLLSLSKSGKLVSQSLVLAFPSILNATLLFVIFLVVFGIVGVFIFGGLPFMQGNYEFGLLIGFDNLYQAVYSLFSLSTQEYLPLAFRHYVNDLGSLLYFVCFIILGFWVVANVFISLLTEEFSDTAAKLRDLSGDTDEVRRARLVLNSVTNSICTPIRPSSNSSLIKKFCFNLCNFKFFEPIITLLIVFNSLLLASYHADMGLEFTNFITLLGDILTIIFAIEITIKMIGLGRMFWVDNWNLFDLFVVLITLVTLLSDSSLGSFVILFRTLRILRIVRLSKKLVSIRKIIRTTRVALPALFGVFTVSFVFYFVFAVFGMNFFGSIPTNIVKHGLFEPITHFRTFFSTMFTLIRATSGEEWQGVMLNSAYCPADNPNCHGTFLSIMFFIPLIYIGKFILINLVSAAVVDAYVSASKDIHATVAPSDVSDFMCIWSDLDPDGLGFIEISKLEKLFCALKPPLSPSRNIEVVNTVLRSLDVPLYNRLGDEKTMYICIYDLLPSVIIRLLGPSTINIPKDIEKTIKFSQKKRYKAMKRFNFNQNELTLREMFSARFILGKYQSLAEKKKEEAEYANFSLSELLYVEDLLSV